MRITAAVLVVLGSLLTLTIVWAAVGFLMMGFGLICGLVAERRERRHVRSSSQRPAQLARANSSRASMTTPAPVVRYGATSPTRLPGHGSSPDRAFTRGSAIPDFESSGLFDPDRDAAPGEQVYDEDTARYDWVEAVDQPLSGDGSTRSSRDHTIIVHPSHLVSNGTAQLSEADEEKIEETEQLIKLLNRMRVAKPLGS